ncbi:16S rRNA (guanine(527)-N(7))-methyltransferase RsmG [Sphingomonas sp. 10B4]|uniref:16S rRNA (guanine(527)-N(7))-methyltransferase RsmG n=1 Tax=Sphingomonas sp. 10B4 TaxID=3048575 RepID=UPI002AB452E1|nr:RsmG family class I SAM-dependent methyltransferase [Sphingomonas sp. 10B4]MDY7524093.1 class I SAM-dependent methyltransferase [Sphingomonas sp. 10B4]MEB0281711.1 class I SAM-dependent methyltransferase [Sphingomonas sp. 10B4]
MTEDEARDWVSQHFGADGLATMRQLVEIVTAESAQQNLIAPSTLGAMWTRHIVDSAQLLMLAPKDDGVWLDIGSGAGFPGLVVAALTDRPVWLVEPRRRRADFLVQAAEAMGVGERVTVECARIEDVLVDARIISARAVASLDSLFAWGAKCASSATCWILPKGRTALADVTAAQLAWDGVFHVEHSITDPDSLIVLASGVTRR